MKATTLLFTLLFITNLAMAQFGITASYRWNDAKDWKLQTLGVLEEQDILGNGYSIGIDYWFRLKNYRIEFLPELNYSTFSNDLNLGLIVGGSAVDPTIEINFRNTTINTYSLFFNTNFYLFDFKGDCDCPTFSKQGKTLQKGFFGQVSPGLSYFQQKFESPEGDFLSNALAVSLGIGIGFDIGITDLVTFTPTVGVRYYPSVEWEALKDFGNENTFKILDTNSSLTQFFAGARFGIRLDYQSNRRRR